MFCDTHAKRVRRVRQVVILLIILRASSFVGLLLGCANSATHTQFTYIPAFKLPSAGTYTEPDNDES
jgi:hypothetical protein